MSTVTVTSTELAIAEQGVSAAERFALAGFLAGHSGQTRDAYMLDLRQFAARCEGEHLCLFGVRRADIERYGRDLQARGRSVSRASPDMERAQPCMRLTRR